LADIITEPICPAKTLLDVFSADITEVFVRPSVTCAEVAPINAPFAAAALLKESSRPKVSVLLEMMMDCAPVIAAPTAALLEVFCSASVFPHQRFVEVVKPDAVWNKDKAQPQSVFVPA